MLSILAIVCLLLIGSIGKHTNHKPRNNENNNDERNYENDNNEDEDSITETIELHNSCIDLSDGMYYIKPTEDGLVIPVICSNTYTMIDISLNFDAITSYFSSWDYSKSDTYIIGPELDDYVSWREWWTIADETYLFRAASNCHKCYTDNDFSDNGAYYMSSYYFCFSTAMEPECVIDDTDGTFSFVDGFDIHACSWCDDGKGHNEDNTARIWTKCTSLRFDADTLPNTDHYNCVTHALVYRPSAVTNRDACTCYKPSEKKSTTTYTVAITDLPPVTISASMDADTYIDPMIIIASDIDEDYDTDFSELSQIYLSNKDFESGTYIISERGEYILTENIIISFNEPPVDLHDMDDFSANAYDIDDLYWYPRHDQSDTYPGLYTYHSKFTLGFFAGISIECDDVIINLNGFSLSMDYRFYFQQRFFSLIELGNQPFIGGQGPANWGADQLFANNVIIKDGILGLSSHHSIHGNHNTNIQITNVRMTSFDVAGFGCNACQQILVSSCIVGPQNTNIPVLGRYTHARTFLPRIRDLVHNFGEQYMTFSNREPILVSGLADRMINQMDMIYNYYIKNVQYEEDDSEWQAAKKLFFNEAGWMDGGSSYGLVFNGDGAAVIGIGCRTDQTQDITISDVEIYGIYCKPIEKPKFQSNGAIRLSFFDSLDWPAVLDNGLSDPYTATYLGDSYTDLVFAVNHFVTSWYYLNSLRITPAMQLFVENGDVESQTAFGDEYDGVCGSDIQLHSSKGAIGLRIDGTQNINLNNIYVHDIQNWGDLGIALCGEYHYPTVSHEDPQIQYGYTGNRAQGIIASYASGSMSDITIENIESYYGSAWGMTLYKGNEFVLSNINVQSIYAGTQLTVSQAQELILPNNMPLACSVELREGAIVTSLNTDDDGSFEDIIGVDIIGHKLCNNPTNKDGDLLGICDDESCHMYDGDTMNGIPIDNNGDTTDNNNNNNEEDDASTSTSSGDNSGGDRIETAPIAVDPPALPLQYIIDGDSFEDIAIPEGAIGVASACNYLSDGLQYILPYGYFDEETAPLLPVICSNGNTILDVSLSFDRYSQYFSSLYMYDVGIAGPQIEDFSTWREWFLPLESSTDFIYGVSDNCVNDCLTADNNVQDTGYYMTGNFYLCAWITKGDCDMDAETYECYQCARHGGRSTSIYPGVCSHVAQSVDFAVHNDHFQCTGNNDNLKPSIGLLHQFCVCYNPTINGLYKSYIFPDEIQYNQQLLDFDTEDNDADTVDDGSNNIVYLSNTDFVSGTYRILSAGIYILTEDILLNFNAPTETEKNDIDFSPNSYEFDYWMPASDGSQDEEYFGSSTWNGPYQLGFFSGITIECANVIIDLNGFSIGMSDEFYLQQRFFSIFELAAKNFVAGQGPVDFGPYLNAANNVIIKNGIIDKVTHHGIHGNDASSVTLSNLQILNFDVAGIQLNGFNDITIENCDIGPSSVNIPVTGRYLHARTLLKRFRHLVDNYGDESLTFYNREASTVRQYVDELILQMDMIYFHVINGVEYEDEDARWLKAKDLFLNPNENGYGDGGVVYGILLNSRGGAVMGFGNAPASSTGAVINNVKIHDLAISPLEKLKFKTNPVGGATRGPVADVFDIIKVSDGFLEDISTCSYVGSAYSDVQIVMSQFEKSWVVLDHTCFDEGLISWALNGDAFGSDYYGGCNTDIQLHINKGVIGLRIDNIVDFEIDNVSILNLLNSGDLGVETPTLCGAYTQGNAHQDPLITAGYTGTEGYGITITQSFNGRLSNINVDQLTTYYGFATGIALFKGSQDIVFDENISINNIIAGAKLEITDLKPAQKYLPNKIPMACSVFDNNYNTQYVLNDNENINAQNIYGYLLCDLDTQMIGVCDVETCVAQYEQSYFDELADESESISYYQSKKSKISINHNKYQSKYVIIGFVLLTIIALFMYYFYPSQYTKIKYDKIQKNIFVSESTPLLKE